MTAFDNTLTEAASVVASHGFAEADFGTVEDGGFNALVHVSGQALMNLGETDLRSRLLAVNGGAACIVWFRHERDGYVHSLMTALDTPRWADDVVRKFHEAAATHEDMLA